MEIRDTWLIASVDDDLAAFFRAAGEDARTIFDPQLLPAAVQRGEATGVIITAGYPAGQVTATCRALQQTLATRVMLIAPPDDPAQIAQAVALGVTDILFAPASLADILARARAGPMRREEIAALVEQVMVRVGRSAPAPVERPARRWPWHRRPPLQAADKPLTTTEAPPVFVIEAPPPEEVLASTASEPPTQPEPPPRKYPPGWGEEPSPAATTRILAAPRAALAHIVRWSVGAARVVRWVRAGVETFITMSVLLWLAQAACTLARWAPPPELAQVFEWNRVVWRWIVLTAPAVAGWLKGVLTQ